MSTTTTTASPVVTSSFAEDPIPAHNVNPVVAFIIGLAIILLASVLNAAGLNLTKLDHVRTSAVPKSARKKDWMRPLWLLGMLLYILSQLIGSTLALEYMRAEYVAPLGSTSLVFNFLFARFLVGTPVTSTDIYGTVVVILGVIGIVAFGSINSGLTTDTDVAHITYLWRRGGWLSYFFTMSLVLFLVIVFTSRLDFVLAARADLAAVPFSATRPVMQGSAQSPSFIRKGWLRKVFGLLIFIKYIWDTGISWTTDRLEQWAGPKDDKQVAWTLGIGWACCGGALAGGCLVFAKATVKLISGSLSHKNPGNQFGHVAPIFTILLLALTAVLQIICLNRGLKVYDSTLVVPVFYGVYTATGWLNSLIFNDEVQAYQSWTLFLIFASIIVLIGGVVLLTHKKPEPITGKIRASTPRRRLPVQPKQTGDEVEDDDEMVAGEGSVLWAVGNASDDEDDGEDEDVDHHQHPLHKELPKGKFSSLARSQSPPTRRSNDESAGLARNDEEAMYDSYLLKGRQSTSTRRSMDPFREDQDGENLEDNHHTVQSTTRHR
ncbi:hypothetical protein CVT24_005145 [Panaeolus cyanescens]|uniref:Uncharacterized protein n=1 Tax=Panaeolus cyanescens TaxID=181874 RepID=A0A409V9R7_9AGAR|nr:hypothetical protein CVT24_005145 [Panaeolus cyanescens]